MIRRLVRKCARRFPQQIFRSVVRGIGNMVSGLGDMKNIQSRLERNMELNRMEEMYAGTMEEFLIGGLVVHRKWYGRKGSRTDCWTDFVLPDNFFCDTGARDFRNWDTGMVGEIHELEFDSLCASFARCPEDYVRPGGYTA